MQIQHVVLSIENNKCNAIQIHTDLDEANKVAEAWRDLEDGSTIEQIAIHPTNQE